ncbi:MAG: hypothetical protein K2X82_18960 [Gemmataceae bacterium]|nr:hypothetical protein [Gemmataceae bacterium]
MPPKIGHSTYSETFVGYSIAADEWEFIKAVAAYQKRWGRRYPSWREVLHVARALGYRKVAAPEPFADPTPAEAALVAAARQHEARAAGLEPPDPAPPPEADPAAA